MRTLVAAAFVASLLLPACLSASQPRPVPAVGPVAWAPDSQRLAVMWDRPEGQDVVQGIYVMRPDGSHRVDLTPNASAYAPAWSPNGKRIAFDVPGSDRAGDGNLKVMSADGSRVRLLAKNINEPAWSPDGRLLVGWTFGDRGINLEIFTASGRLVRKVTIRSLAVRFPFWSSDGRWIEFYANGATGPVYAVRPNGKHLHVARRIYADSCDSWSHDGAAVAYVSSGALYLKKTGQRPRLLLP